MLYVGIGHLDCTAVVLGDRSLHILGNKVWVRGPGLGLDSSQSAR